MHRQRRVGVLNASVRLLVFVRVDLYDGRLVWRRRPAAVPAAALVCTQKAQTSHENLSVADLPDAARMANASFTAGVQLPRWLPLTSAQPN